MTTVVATLNLDTLGLTVEQFAEFAKDNFWYVKEPEKEWSAHVRDLTTPWEPWGPAQVWKEATGPFKPGVYALVYDPKDEIRNPILSNQTIVFGESTRPAYHRLYAHVGALRGKSTNMSDKYRKHENGKLCYLMQRIRRQIWVGSQRIQQVPDDPGYKQLYPDQQNHGDDGDR